MKPIETSRCDLCWEVKPIYQRVYMEGWINDSANLCKDCTNQIAELFGHPEVEKER